MTKKIFQTFCSQEQFGQAFSTPTRDLVSNGIYVARALITTTDGQRLQQISKIIKN